MDKPARWIAFRKLPNRRRIVFSDGRIPASVHLSAVGSEPCSATNSRRAATYSWIRVSATSDSGAASPSNTPGGFVLWELRSTKFRDRARARSSVVTGRGHGETSSRRIDLLAVTNRDREVVGLAGGHLFRLLVRELADLDSRLVVEGVNEREVVAVVLGPIVELDEAG